MFRSLKEVGVRQILSCWNNFLEVVFRLMLHQGFYLKYEFRLGLLVDLYGLGFVSAQLCQDCGFDSFTAVLD